MPCVLIPLITVVPHAGTWIEILHKVPCYPLCLVVPHAGTWIEIFPPGSQSAYHLVVPHAGTWIEIPVAFSDKERQQSFPTRERGLKSLCDNILQCY